jgi:hypothetical protein
MACVIHLRPAVNPYVIQRSIALDAGRDSGSRGRRLEAALGAEGAG